MSTPWLLKQTARIWDRNVKAARLAYVQALKARFASKCTETDRLVEQNARRPGDRRGHDAGGSAARGRGADQTLPQYVERAAHFKERKDLWGTGVSCRPYDLMVRILAEKCPDWNEEKRAAFEASFKKPAETK